MSWNRNLSFLAYIHLNPLFHYQFTVDKRQSNDATDSTSPRIKRLRSNDLLAQRDDPAIFQSQPVPQISYKNDLDMSDANGDARRVDFCYSQPALMDDLILCTQLNSTQGTSQNVFQRLVKRMTRFFVTVKLDETIKRLSTVVEELGYTWRICDASVVRIILHFHTILIEMIEFIIMLPFVSI